MINDAKLMSISGWDTFSPRLQQEISEQARSRYEKAGSIVFHQGMAPEVVAWTMKGLLFTQVQHANGNQTLLTHIPPGRLVLFNHVWRQRPVGRDYYAVTDVELLIIPRRYAAKLLAQHEEFKMFVIDALTERLDDLDRVLYTHKVASRELCIACFLVDCSVAGDDCVYLPFTMQFMADCLRLSRKFIANSLKKFQNNSLIDLRYGKIYILDIGRLRKIAYQI
ncbi:Crp/Fnr family transcriptional regulator [Sodalis ligni]|jgi:CRP/FNR family cyclic AMP-dependent transcriptional regulator|uniref:Crp/Fnr family transcriptional regulator n=1 Tax=Sodalis ligni TaxID=2697027 RepID=A0A4R1N7N3_9GAMM|nr:Crp/Fnr family transcriptional regulator [Sodalis ligni]TCL03193.1 Crp/Fnr family transcriptional regulator [Sodalis ligni]